MQPVSEVAQPALPKLDWWDEAKLGIGLLFVLVLIVALWWYAGVVLWVILALAWRPLLHLAIAWLVVGTAAAVLLVPNDLAPLWCLPKRIINDITRRSDQLRRDSQYRLTEAQARVLARHEFWTEWWQMVGGLPAALIAAAMLILVTVLTGGALLSDEDDFPARDSMP